MKNTNYSLCWDKLINTPVGSEFTTVRSRYMYQFGKEVDKAATYYATKELYQQQLNEKPLFTASLIGIEVTAGKAIHEQLLIEDVMYRGEPQMVWIGKIRAMKDALVLHFKKLDEAAPDVVREWEEKHPRGAKQAFPQ